MMKTTTPQQNGTRRSNNQPQQIENGRQNNRNEERKSDRPPQQREKARQTDQATINQRVKKEAKWTVVDNHK
jgi:hypothetical protein